MIYFTLDELCASSTATSRGILNTPSPEVVKSLESLVLNILDPARSIYGKPIRVGSGYRSAALNKAVNGATNSQHMYGEAADLNTGSKEGNRQLFNIIKQLGLFDQLINEYDYSWIHVSYKRTGTNRRQILKIV